MSHYSTNKYRDALEAIQIARSCNHGLGYICVYCLALVEPYFNIAAEALTIAQKLQEEPSEGMYWAGREAFKKPENRHGAVLDEVFKAMVNQLLKDIQGDKGA